MATIELTDYCPHCDRQTKQTYIKEADAQGNIFVNITTCAECGRVIED